MALPKLSPLEFQIMDALWTQGPTSVREVQEHLPGARRSAYTTVQTTMYRLETKGALRRTKKIGNAHIFEAMISRQAAQGRVIDDVVRLFGGRMQPMMVHLIEAGTLTLEDVQEAEKLLRELSDKGSAS